MMKKQKNWSVQVPQPIAVSPERPTGSIRIKPESLHPALTTGQTYTTNPPSYAPVPGTSASTSHVAQQGPVASYSAQSGTLRGRLEESSRKNPEPESRKVSSTPPRAVQPALKIASVDVSEFEKFREGVSKSDSQGAGVTVPHELKEKVRYHMMTSSYVNRNFGHADDVFLEQEGGVVQTTPRLRSTTLPGISKYSRRVSFQPKNLKFSSQTKFFTCQKTFGK